MYCSSVFRKQVLPLIGFISIIWKIWCLHMTPNSQSKVSMYVGGEMNFNIHFLLSYFKTVFDKTYLRLGFDFSHWYWGTVEGHFSFSPSVHLFVCPSVHPSISPFIHLASQRLVLFYGPDVALVFIMVVHSVTIVTPHCHC